MNIFDQYLNKIKKTLLDLSENKDLILPKSLDGITAEIPPSKFDSDISTNVAMVLSKINKKSPIDLANTLSEEIKKKDKLIDNISVVKPGFINIKFKPIFWTNFIKEIIENSNSYGINTKEEFEVHLINSIGKRREIENYFEPVSSVVKSTRIWYFPHNSLFHMPFTNLKGIFYNLKWLLLYPISCLNFFRCLFNSKYDLVHLNSGLLIVKIRF